MKRTMSPHKKIVLQTVIILGLMISFVGQNLALAMAEEEAENQRGEHILIQFEPQTSEAERNAIIADLGGRLLAWLAPLYTAEVLLLQRGGTVGAANINPAVRFIEIDDAVVAGTYTPNDPALAETDQGYAHKLLQTTVAWDYERGSDQVIIAVLDTGVDATHSEFINRITAGIDLVSNDDDPTDDHGHGTHISGIIAANMDNGTGNVGICPNCQVMPVKVLDASNRGRWSTVAKGVVYAVDNGAKVINMSLGGTSPSSTLETALEYAKSKGVLVVAAAGNYASSSNFYPAAYADVMAVAATDQNDSRWALSNYGDYIDVTAPGSDIYSTMRSVDGQPEYTFMSGTSMASPYVAGLAGLLLSQDSERTAEDVRNLITTTADDLGEAGKDIFYGYGRINARSALGYNTQSEQPIAHGISSNQVFLPSVTK